MPADENAETRRGALMELCAEDIMQRGLITVRAGDSLPDAERALVEAQVGGAPVVDESDRVCGVVSIRDLLRHRTEDGDLPEGIDADVFDDVADETELVAFERPGAGACVADVMTQELVSVTPATPLPQIAALMVKTRVHRALVLDRGALVGLVSTMDILRVVAQGA